jgi:hypothetical protein
MYYKSLVRVTALGNTRCMDGGIQEGHHKGLGYLDGASKTVFYSRPFMFIIYLFEDSLFLGLRSTGIHKIVNEAVHSIIHQVHA